MTDIARQKFAALMEEIDSLEDAIGDLRARCDKTMAGEAQAQRQQLLDMQRQLGEKRTELQRISDGCGKPRVI